MSEVVETTMPKKHRAWWIWVVLAALVVFYFVFGFITIQPIGAIPDGVTLLVVRANTKLKFFDSPDAMCERTMGGVSLLCRMTALSTLAEGPTIVSRLPYIESFYLASTGGVTYKK